MIIISFKANLNSLCSPSHIEIPKRFVLFGFGFFFPRKGFYSKNVKFLKNSDESLLSLVTAFEQKHWVIEDLETLNNLF